MSDVASSSSKAAADRPTGGLAALIAAGQSVWLDFIDRDLLAGGGLDRLIADDGVSGVTSNPTIFERAMGHGAAYDAQIREEIGRDDPDPVTLYERCAVADVQAAADRLRPVYERSRAHDGYVSLEVSPHVARDVRATVDDAHRLRALVGRPNLMIKVPGTAAGIAALGRLVEDGVNVNVTLLFSPRTYADVADAHLAGLEARAEAGLPIDAVASVASFFVSRIDTLVDARIDGWSRAGTGDAATVVALRGRTALACARLAYRRFRDVTASPRWRALANRGAGPQRLLWASTGVKDPAYADTLYVDGLVGARTVSTMPPRTLDAVRDHGKVTDALLDAAGATSVVEAAHAVGIDLERVAEALLEQGLASFSASYDALVEGLDRKRSEIRATL